jgi:hypothetical protein
MTSYGGMTFGSSADNREPTKLAVDALRFPVTKRAAGDFWQVSYAN